LYSASCGYQPPLMRCHVTNGSRLTTQATAHSLHTRAWAATRLLARQSQSAVGLHLRNPSLMDYYSFNQPRMDGRLSWPCWLTDSGRFTHKVVTWPAVSLAQDIFCVLDCYRLLHCIFMYAFLLISVWSVCCCYGVSINDAGPAV